MTSSCPRLLSLFTSLSRAGSLGSQTSFTMTAAITQIYFVKNILQIGLERNSINWCVTFFARDCVWPSHTRWSLCWLQWALSPSSSRPLWTIHGYLQFCTRSLACRQCPRRQQEVPYPLSASCDGQCPWDRSQSDRRDPQSHQTRVAQ